jgi:hypothetical protein
MTVDAAWNDKIKPMIDIVAKETGVRSTYFRPPFGLTHSRVPCARGWGVDALCEGVCSRDRVHEGGEGRRRRRACTDGSPERM